MAEAIAAKGGAVETGAVLEAIEVAADGSVAALRMRDGTRVVADEYVSAMPVDVLKRLVPEAWSAMPYFRQLDELEGIPVINLQLWFDTKFESSLDGLAFSRSPLLSVYADMSRSCAEYASDDASMLELVFAPATKKYGADRDWLGASDDAIVAATLDELRRLFPTELARANLRKAAVVRVPRSVYAAVPGRNKYRPSQRTPVPNLTLCGCFTSQKFLGSMEGAVLAGKLAAEVVAARAVGAAAPGLKAVPGDVGAGPARAPRGVAGSDAVAFGGGATRAAAVGRA